MKPKLFEDIRLAMGERSYGQVATASGISKPTLSRMVNQTYKRTISPSLLWKLAAAAQNNVTFELLMHDANFSDSEISKYRSKYESGGSNASNKTSTFVNNVVYLLLALAADDHIAFTHEITLHEGDIGELRIISDGNPIPAIYIIDGADAASGNTSVDRRFCELLGRCVVASAKEKCEVSIVTPSDLLFIEIASLSVAIVSQVILVSSTGDAFIERKRY